ncbi:MAG: NADP(H)-dependent aldo-keto reductase [Alphaproteobacteria bacterium]|nr:NADP(H)-dependent aldo-keto reductase [Alphaproteobacteria bacterium]
MQYRPLGKSGISVSVIGLGTMTWGQQNSEAEAHAQLDYALERGITLIDTAEMYPVPPRKETQGRTESYIGTWLKARKCRDKIVLATKVAGGSRDVDWLRPKPQRLDRRNITAAIDASLKRLQTDYVDLYQTHWPDRPVNNFGKRDYVHADWDEAAPLEETLGVLADLVKAGKVRALGISNETPWGTMRLLAAAERSGLPRIVSIQNPYNLLNRAFEIGAAEIAHRENVSLLAYSPLGMGVLSGKYAGGAKPAGARMTLFERFKRYTTPIGLETTDLYVAIARKHGLDPAQMALSFVNSRPFVASNLIGATTMAQLKADIDSIDLALKPEVEAEIQAVHARHGNVCG